jgi:tRNA G18 (ribose-2'-O)-methylase SpoU
MLRQRKSKRERRESRDQALARYTRHKQRNLLAAPGVHEFIIVLDRMKAGFNVAKIFRSAEAFGAHEVHLIDIGPFDPAPAKGAFKKVPARFFSDFNESYRDLINRGYDLYALMPGDQASVLNLRFQSKSAFVLGHEEYGLSFDLADYPQINRLSIPQFGQVQSLNVAVAASVVMFEYVRQQKSRLEES